MALTLVRGPSQLLALAPRLAPLLLFSDLLEIETALPETETDLPEIQTDVPEIETTLPEIETALPEIETEWPEIDNALLEIKILSHELNNKYQPHKGPIFELWPYLGMDYYTEV